MLKTTRLNINDFSIVVLLSFSAPSPVAMVTKGVQCHAVEEGISAMLAKNLKLFLSVTFGLVLNG